MTDATNTTTLPGLPEAFYKCKGSFGEGVERFEMAMPDIGIRRRLVVLVRTSPSATWYVAGMEVPGGMFQQSCSTDWEHTLKFVEELLPRG